MATPIDTIGLGHIWLSSGMPVIWLAITKPDLAQTCLTVQCEHCPCGQQQVNALKVNESIIQYIFTFNF